MTDTSIEKRAREIARVLNPAEAAAIMDLAAAGSLAVVDVSGPMGSRDQFMPRFIEFIFQALAVRGLASQHDGRWVCSPLGRAVAAHLEKKTMTDTNETTRLERLEAFAQYVIENAPETAPDEDDRDEAMMCGNPGDTWVTAQNAIYSHLAERAHEALADPDASGGAKKMPDFEGMTQKEAVAYLHRHRDEFICGISDGVEQFDCLVELIGTGSPPMSPTRLPEHGFEFPE